MSVPDFGCTHRTDGSACPECFAAGPLSDPPTLMSLRGIAPNLTGGMESTEWIKQRREEMEAALAAAMSVSITVEHYRERVLALLREMETHLRAAGIPKILICPMCRGTGLPPREAFPGEMEDV